MKKFLMVATVPSMIGQFNMENLRILLNLGYEVHVACNFSDRSVWSEERVEMFREQLKQMNIKRIQIEFARTPYNIPQLVKSYFRLRRIISKEKYTALHCHTPVAGMIARLAALGKKTKVIYTAHGFHFFKGAPLKNWVIYYPIEKICSYMTDVLITINKEDYALAQKKLKAKEVVYVPGVGVDTRAFGESEDNGIRTELAIPESGKLLLSVGELNDNKNHESVIKALAEIEQVKTGKVFYAIVGKGVLEDRLSGLIQELKLEKQVFLCGFRRDVAQFYDAADIYVFPSFREGLSVALMEAMASGLPVACSEIRGNTDLVNENGGVLFHPGNIEELREKLEEMICMPREKLEKMGEYNLKRIKEFDKKVVEECMEKIYNARLKINKTEVV